jgi:hypothetical protein
MKRFRYPYATAILLLLGLIFFNNSYAQAPVNDNCSSAITLTSGNTCNSTTYSIRNATSSGLAPTAACGGITNTAYDVWFTFQAVNATTSITLSTLGTQFNKLGSYTPYLEVLSGSSCSGFVSLGCQAISTAPSRLTISGLTVGTFYYIRIYVLLNPTASGNGKWNFNICVQHQPANDDCTGAINLTPGATCTNTAGTLDLATANAIGINTSCSMSGTSKDVWYKFTASTTTNYTVTLSNLGTNVTSPGIQIYSGSCGLLTYLSCANGTTLTSAVVIGVTYFVRISNSAGADASGTGNVANFNVCLTTSSTVPPVNDDCTGAILLTSGTSCNNISGTLVNATISSTAAGTCKSASSADVWYSFVAQSAYPTISLSSYTAKFGGVNGAKPTIDLYSGSCASLSSLGTCTNSGTFSVLSQVGGAGLTVGNTYYIRVGSSSATGNPAAGTYGFNICITDPTGSATIDYGKSYINIKQNKYWNGGTVDPGDTLEIRATLVVGGTGSYDSIAYYDTLRAGSGFALVPGSISLRTNEGKVYLSYSDVFDADAGWRLPLGSDTVIQINMGGSATNVKRGSIANTSLPSFYGSTCIVIATYRVVVYAGYNTKIKYGGGRFSYRNQTSGVLSNVNFASDSLIVYQSPGLCPNSVSPANIISDEYGGTFGTASSSAAGQRNRGTSPNTNYLYTTFGAGSPQDYYYGIADNTSGSTYTATNTTSKPNATRVHNVWDITGDHTGATNSAIGNPPCDPTKPISTSNPCGYMMIVNAAYSTDTAFQYNVSGLCPNTNYEISAWLKNVCSKCGCDVNGNGNGSVGYIPTGTGDSSGVKPNIAFDIDGVNYYTTGNLQHQGLLQVSPWSAGSDTANRWMQRGFTFKTGPSQTSFVLTLKNNAPGGGGNDWAIDDIALKTCSPDVTVTPGPNPFVCDANTVDMGARISSYFNTYVYYSWEKSIDNGVTWGSTGVGGGPTSPTWNGSAWTYDVTYPTFVALAADSGSKYRVVIASTASNLSSSSCRFSGGATITLTVDPCDTVLNVGILSFKGRNENNQGVLYWTTSKEEEPVKYEIQKSKGAGSFVTIDEITGYKDPSAETNRYTYVDPESLDNTISWYRIKAIKTQDNKSKYSKVVQLIGDKAGLQIESLINPFNSHVKFDLISGDDGLIQVEILDQYQHRLKFGSYNLIKGRNRINIDNTDNLPAGFYILRVTSNNNVINRKIIKRG